MIKLFFKVNKNIVTLCAEILFIESAFKTTVYKQCKKYQFWVIWIPRPSDYDICEVRSSIYLVHYSIPST